MKSFAEKILREKGGMRKKDFEKHKMNSLKTSVFLGLFVWLFLGVFVKNIFLSGAIALLFISLSFLFLLSHPASKMKKLSKKVEADLPFFLLQFSTEMQTGKSFSDAMKSSSEEDNYAAKEFALVIRDVEKGMGFSEAFKKMGSKFPSLTMRRALSNLSNIQKQGKGDVESIKKLSSEMLSKQRTESKEFSNKMVMYSLVFIAVSAIVPAMFQSFILIGSYFMSISFTAEQALAIIVFLFPLIDVGILAMISSKTPEFLRQ